MYLVLQLDDSAVKLLQVLVRLLDVQLVHRRSGRAAGIYRRNGKGILCSRVSASVQFRPLYIARKRGSTPPWCAFNRKHPAEGRKVTQRDGETPMAELRVMQEKLLSLQRSVKFSMQAVSLLKRTGNSVRPGEPHHNRTCS